ncbi:MAG TPA: DHA2 family efflux MFS transporter permease subunit [Candidatus Dormibacteraeota bacterium]|nr:DHA2 family efflux MFS transporter permease subunit [Candidatus Dormibacteraeota bacterium]
MRRLTLGPRARSAIRFAARFINPLTLLVAGRSWMPIVGVLRHRGRRTGRAYATPLGMRRIGDAFVMPLTFSDSAAWYRNVIASGACDVRYMGRDYTLAEPEVIDFATAAPAFPRYELLQFRVVGISEYLRMRVVQEKTTVTKPRNLSIALLVIAFAQLMVVLDTTIVNVALPSVQRALHFNATDLEWVVNGYALAFGGLLLLGGRSGDLFGRRRMFISGVLLFAAGSFAGGLATTSTWLIAARVLQGAGGAIVAPTALSLIADTFQEGAARNRALGVYAGAAGSGGAIGLILGGLIVNYLSWRWVLFVNVPIALALAIAAPRVLPASEGRPGRLDLPGAISVTGAMSLLVYGFSRAATHSWTENVTVATLGAGAALLVLFLLIERRSRQPLMPLSIFANRNRTGAFALRMIAGSTTLVVLFFMSQIVQNVLGYSPLQAGFAFLPLGVGVIVTAQVTSRLIGRTGPRLPILVGSLTVAAGLAWASQITDQARYVPDIVGPLAVLSVGLGLIFFPTTVVAISGAGRHESGLASAVLNVSQQLGGSVGLSVLGTIAASVTGARVAGFTTAFEIGVPIALAGFVLALIVIGARRPQAAAASLPEAA